MKIVINNCYGGFGLSDKCSEALGGVRYETFDTSYTTPNGETVRAFGYYGHD